MTVQRDNKSRGILQFRPHHFLCSLGFQGKGYSPKFVQNFSAIVAALQKEDGNQQLIEVVSDCDSICKACPRRLNRVCQQEENISRLDDKHQAVLGLSVGQILSWREAKVLLKDRMTIQSFHRVCSSCVWKKLGYCETALKHLATDESVEVQTLGKGLQM